MVQDIEIPATQNRAGVNPKKFALWLFIVSITMLFAALTSAYMVRKSYDPEWLNFNLPSGFLITSVIIILSSFSAQWAYISAKNNSVKSITIGLLVTFILGLAFVVGQYYAWGQLVKDEVFFVGNPGGSFIYVLTGVHAFHIISGLIFLIITLIAAFRYKIHSKNINLMEMFITYWHFLGGLWVYLYIFLIFQH